MILITGAGGFIGRAVAEALGRRARSASHRDIGDKGLLDGVTAIVHAGRDQHLGQPGYRLENDVELKLADAAAARDLPFLMLSTRKVYAANPEPLREASPLGPVDRYGAHKLAMEEALLARLGHRLTRLRLANIFGFEPGRRSFMGAMQDGLAGKGTITFDMSPFTTRDFLPVELAAQAIAKLALSPRGGIVNIGSGVPLMCGRLAMALITGHKSGRLLVTDPAERDAFTLDVARMQTLTGVAADEAALIARAEEIGVSLRRARS